MRTEALLSAAILAACAVGCAGGQTGDEGEDWHCSEEARALAADEVSPLGFSAADVLAYAQGSHSTSLEWQTARSVPYGPETGVGELSIEVESLGSARFVERTAPKGAVKLIHGDCCPESVEIDVQVTLRTAGGALNETFEAVLDATERDAAYLLTLIQPPLRGALTFDSQALHSAHLEDVQLDARFGPSELSGSLHARFESEASGEDLDGAVSLSIEPLAQWGEWSSLPLCGE